LHAPNRAIGENKNPPAAQPRMKLQVDAARRLDAQKHGPRDFAADRAVESARLHHGAKHHFEPHPRFHHGAVSPHYASHCIRYRYWGPSFFAGLCWYPSWSPWVEWTWGYRCGPYWDPRPIWRRPVYCEPCPRWVYWDTPVFVVLPETPSGAWVDLKPVEVAPSQIDVQLVAVRFVDPGHPEEKQGPRYRVWLRNNSAEPISQPFHVVLLAASNEKLSDDLPQAGVRIDAIGAGEIQSVDIRLPAEVYAMNRDALGRSAPFSNLHVLVDADRQLNDIDRTNNGACLTPADILPVDPVAFELAPATAKPGDTVILAGEGLGPEPGQVLVLVEGKELEAEIQGWYDLGVRWTVPQAAASGEAQVIVIRGDGVATNPVKLVIP